MLRLRRIAWQNWPRPIDSESPSRDTLEHVATLSGRNPRPVVVFAEDDSDEPLRLAMQAEHIHARASNLRVTLSIGVAASTSEDLAVADVLARADRALYKAKAKGRNRVEAA